ncbi:MAG: extracellular solute-binding protein [Chloroflexi bacterium]|nr:extracellular solute-binding protein [Chloroflexota bacterium]
MKKMVLFFVIPAIAALAACSQPPAPPVPNVPVVTAPAPGAEVVRQTWQQQWDSVVAGARKEGVVAITASWSPPTRDNVIRAFKEKYGISVEVSTGGSAQLGQKVLAERRAGIFNYDATVQGTNFGINLMKPVDAFDPAEPALILQEIKDPKAWLGGEFPWFDRARTMIPFFARLDTNLSVNTSLVKPGEITAYKDVLDPKWKGKIILRDPTTVGTGSGWFRENGKDLGTDFMRALVKQELIFSENDRQCVEWLARGKGSILIAGSADQLTFFMKEGSPVEIIDARDSRTFSPSSGIVSLVNRAPHPNAARLFINWILTREGQTLLTKTEGLPSRRLDVPTDHILPVLMLRQDRKYREYTEDDVAGDADAQIRSKEIFGPFLGK